MLYYVLLSLRKRGCSHHLIVEHGDGLDGLDRVVELDDGVAARLPFLVPAELDGDAAAGKAEDLAHLLLVDGVGQLQREEGWRSRVLIGFRLEHSAHFWCS